MGKLVELIEFDKIVLINYIRIYMNIIYSLRRSLLCIKQ